jgi:hypothetical protein
MIKNMQDRCSEMKIASCFDASWLNGNSGRGNQVRSMFETQTRLMGPMSDSFEDSLMSTLIIITKAEPGMSNDEAGCLRETLIQQSTTNGKSDDIMARLEDALVDKIFVVDPLDRCRLGDACLSIDQLKYKLAREVRAFRPSDREIQPFSELAYSQIVIFTKELSEKYRDIINELDIVGNCDNKPLTWLDNVETQEAKEILDSLDKMNNLGVSEMGAAAAQCRNYFKSLKTTAEQKIRREIDAQEAARQKRIAKAKHAKAMADQDKANKKREEKLKKDLEEAKKKSSGGFWGSFARAFVKPFTGGFF